MLVNGAAIGEIGINDRGFLYGDGVFRSFQIRHSRPVLWAKQYAKLHHDCTALKLTCPDESLLLSEVLSLSRTISEGVGKIIITRGTSERGYAPPAHTNATRVVTVSSAPNYPESHYSHGVRVHLCELQLARQPRLAGIKHLNRLENVLAAAEWQDPTIAEGLLMDEFGNVIEGTRSNLFALINGELLTSPLAYSGVAGVQRDRVLAWAAEQQFPHREANFSLDELRQADEIFLVNSVFGLWPVREFIAYARHSFPISHQIQKWLADESH
jgi:4-amino-4-deoxychorismate lyase